MSTGHDLAIAGMDVAHKFNDLLGVYILIERVESLDDFNKWLLRDCFDMQLDRLPYLNSILSTTLTFKLEALTENWKFSKIWNQAKRLEVLQGTARTGLNCVRTLLTKLPRSKVFWIEQSVFKLL